MAQSGTALALSLRLDSWFPQGFLGSKQPFLCSPSLAKKSLTKRNVRGIFCEKPLDDKLRDEKVGEIPSRGVFYFLFPLTE